MRNGLRPACAALAVASGASVTGVAVGSAGSGRCRPRRNRLLLLPPCALPARLRSGVGFLPALAAAAPAAMPWALAPPATSASAALALAVSTPPVAVPPGRGGAMGRPHTRPLTVIRQSQFRGSPASQYPAGAGGRRKLSHYRSEYVVIANYGHYG
jgi:hypothetical protein